MPRHDPPELDVIAILLAPMPFLALAGPPRRLALPRPVGLQPVVVQATPSAAAQRPEPPPRPVVAPPEPPRDTPEDSKHELGPSPFDPGFLPPTTGLRERPEGPGPDPRTLSLNRAKRTPSPSAPAPIARTNPRAPQPDAAHDLLILPQMPSFKCSDHGLQAVLNYLRSAQLFSPRTLHDTPEGLVYELSPDVFVHQIFVDGMAPAGGPCVLEATLRAFRAPSAPAFGPPARVTCFALELVGSRFGFVLETFKQRLHQIIYLRPEVHVSPHDPARLRERTTEQPTKLPACDMQEVDRG